MIFARLLPPVAVLLTCLACASTSSSGGGGGSGPVDTDKFPSRDDLARVAAKDLPVMKADVRADIASWTLLGPMPDSFGNAPIKPTGLNGMLIDTLGATKASANLECAARELAALAAANEGKQPEDRLKSWILVRCGVTTGDISTQTLTWTKVPAKMSDADIWKDAREDITKMISNQKNAAHAGIAFQRDAKSGTAMILVAGSTGSPDATIDAMSQVVPADSETIAIAGTVHAPAEVIYAYATKGLLQAAECTLDLSVVLPRFRFTCPVDKADANARIDVGVRRKGRVLGEQVANLLVVRDVAASSAYREATYVDASAGDISVLEAINRVRATAGQQPLRDASAQSEQVKKVAPHYFANLFAEDRDPQISDVVALGLMAGWDVTELTIHDAGFATLLDVSGGGDDLLGYALDHPLPRAVLLDPKMSAAAVGPVTLESGVKGALVLTYEALVPPDHKKAAADVFEKLRAVRKERGLGVTGSIPTEQIMLDAAQKLQAGEEIQDVAQVALQASVDTMGRPFTMWMMEVHDVDHMAFPEQLLTPRTTYVAISVATRKRPKSAWGSTIVLVLGFVEETRVAQLGEIDTLPR